MKKLLITGASGFLAYNILQQPLKNWNVVALTHQRTFSFRNITYLQVDLSDAERVSNILSSVRPDAILHLAAIADANYCEQNSDTSYAVNVTASEILANYASSVNIPFVFTSTDLVFDGEKGNYNEDDVPNPLNEYGKQKASAEKIILQAHKYACVLRMPLMFGYGGNYAKSFLQPFIQSLQNGQALQLFTDEYRSILDGESAAKGILLALDNNWKGIFHIAGTMKISRYDFMHEACGVFQFDKKLLIPKLQKEIVFAAKRPADVSLNIDKAKAKGFHPNDLKTALLNLKDKIIT